jgi:hypothetical protein
MATAGPAGRARQGNGNSFGIRTGPYRRELHVRRCDNSSLARLGLPRTVQG